MTDNSILTITVTMNGQSVTMPIEEARELQKALNFALGPEGSRFAAYVSGSPDMSKVYFEGNYIGAGGYVGKPDWQ